jgi:hypothetical protein
MTHSTRGWGPKSSHLDDLIAFRDRLVTYIDTARQKQDEIEAYRLMLPDLEGELLVVTARIASAQHKVGAR